MANVGFNSPATTSGYTAGNMYSDGISLPTGRAMYNGSTAALITALFVYVGSTGGTRYGVRFSLGSATTGTFNVPYQSASTGSGYHATNHWLVNGGTTRITVYNKPSGPLYFGRSGGGVVQGPTRTWAGRLAGAYTVLQAPSAPRWVNATPHSTSSGRIDLTWSAPAYNGDTAITGYVVQTSGGSYLGTTSGRSFAVTGLTPGSSYSFRVAASNAVTNAAGTYSAVSSNSSAVIAPGVPTAPRSLSASAHSSVAGRVNLSWTAPSVSGAGGIKGYYVYRNGAQVGTTTSTSYSVSGGSQHTNYSFYVRARNNFSNYNGTAGPASNTEYAVAPGVPSAPRSFSASAHASSSGRVNVSWTAPSTTGGSITGYKIYAAGSYNKTVSGGTTSSYVSGLTPGTNYSFVAYATNAYGQSASSNANTAVAPGVPTAPRSLSATASTSDSGVIDLSWTAPSVPGTGGVVGYYIYRDGSGGSTWTTSGTGTTFSTPAQTDHVSYSYTVRARNSFSEANATASPDSNSDSAVAPGAPTAPRTLVGEADAGVAGKVDLTWQTPTTTGGTITGYRIYVDGTLTKTTTGTGTSTNILGLNTGQTYAFTVTARNEIAVAEGSESVASNSVNVMALGIPELESFTISLDPAVSGRAILTWPDGTGGTITGYSIIDVTDPGSKVLIGQVVGNIFIVDDILLGSTRTYTVRARNTYTDTLSGDAGRGGDEAPYKSTTPTQNTTQSTAATEAVSDTTNVGINGTYTVNIATSTTFGYSKSLPNLSSGVVTPIPGALADTAQNLTSEVFNGTFVISVPSYNTITYSKTGANISLRFVSGGELTNNTNTRLAGTYTVVSVPDTDSFTYNSPGLAVSSTSVPENASPGKSTIISNTSNAIYNSVGAVILDITVDTISYANTNDNVPSKIASGSVTDTTNRDKYNTSSVVVDEVTGPRSFTYTVPGAVSRDFTEIIDPPQGEVVRLVSPGVVEIRYRSGWVG